MKRYVKSHESNLKEIFENPTCESLVYDLEKIPSLQNVFHQKKPKQKLLLLISLRLVLLCAVFQLFGIV